MASEAGNAAEEKSSPGDLVRQSVRNAFHLTNKIIPNEGITHPSIAERDQSFDSTAVISESGGEQSQADKKREYNRNAQRVFRQRRKEHLRKLEQAQKEQSTAQSEEVERLRRENQRHVREHELLRTTYDSNTSSPNTGIRPSDIRDSPSLYLPYGPPGVFINAKTSSLSSSAAIPGSTPALTPAGSINTESTNLVMVVPNNITEIRRVLHKLFAPILEISIFSNPQNHLFTLAALALRLPPSLKPTDLQLTTPHHAYIDMIPSPSLRDKLIAIGPADSNVFITQVCTIVLDIEDTGQMIIWGEDWLNEFSWEFSAAVLERWGGWLLTEEWSQRANFWRRQRGATTLIPIHSIEAGEAEWQSEEVTKNNHSLGDPLVTTAVRKDASTSPYLQMTANSQYSDLKHPQTVRTVTSVRTPDISYRLSSRESVEGPPEKIPPSSQEHVDETAIKNAGSTLRHEQPVIETWRQARLQLMEAEDETIPDIDFVAEGIAYDPPKTSSGPATQASDRDGVELQDSDDDGIEFQKSDRGSIESQESEREQTLALAKEAINIEKRYERHESARNTTPVDVGFERVSGLQRLANAMFLCYTSAGVFAKSLFTHRTMPHSSQFTLHCGETNGSRTAVERMKRRIERNIQCNVSWWPLEAPRAKCGLDKTRISWNCSCSASLTVNISNEHAESFCRKTGLVNQAPNQPPLLPTHQTQSSQGISTASQNIPLSTNISGRAVPLNKAGLGKNAVQLSNRTAGAGTNNSSQLPEEFLHWCVSNHTAITRMTELEMKHLSEQTLVPILLATYSAIVGLRSWLTFTSCVGVRFIKFRKLSLNADLVTYLRDELPPRPHPEYEYDYLDSGAPEEDFVRWLQAVIEARIAKPRCPGTLALSNVLEHIPRKVNGRMKTSDGYGMYAVSAFCFWKAVLALVVVSIPSVIFMIRWLIGHDRDWQNAQTWLMVTYTIVNILIWQQDRWLLDRTRL